MIQSRQVGTQEKLAVLYLGFNSPRTHKRGVENVVDLQAASLPSGTRCYYFFIGMCAEAFRWGRMTAIGIPASPLRYLRLNCVAFRLMRKLNRRGYRVLLHSHNYLSSLFLWHRSDIFTVHDGLYYQMKAAGRSYPVLFAVIERLVYGRVDRVQCNSQFTLRNSLLGRTRHRPQVIYCSTPLERLSRAMGPTDRVTNPAAKKTVFTVRSVEQRARFDLLLEVAESFEQSGESVRIVAAGKGPLLEHYRQQIAMRGLRQIELLGYVSDEQLVEQYRKCDLVLMLCEHGEGFGIPAIEGYLFDKPVVASDRCAVPEVICWPDFLVDNEVGAVREAILRALGQPATPGTFRSYYDARFSNEVIEHLFGEMYRRHLEGREGC